MVLSAICWMLPSLLSCVNAAPIAFCSSSTAWVNCPPRLRATEHSGGALMTTAVALEGAYDHARQGCEAIADDVFLAHGFFSLQKSGGLTRWWVPKFYAIRGLSCSPLIGASLVP